MTKFQPMLACREKPDLSKLSYPVLVSPKLDGIRALIVDGVVMSRSMKPIPNKHVQKLFGRPELNGLDGELIVGSATDKNCMQSTTSGVMSVEGEPDVVYYIFDDYSNPGYFSARYDSLEGMEEVGEPIKVVPHYDVHNEIILNQYEEEFVKLGYEGLMIRSLEGKYKHGRSTMREATLFKLKRWEDDEAVIVDVRELERNGNEKTQDAFGRAKRSSAKAGKTAGGTMGELVCCIYAVNQDGSPDILDEGIQFSIGTGFSAVQRDWFWTHREALVGEIVKFKHFAITGVVDKPRNPVFLGMRSKIDL